MWLSCLNSLKNRENKEKIDRLGICGKMTLVKEVWIYDKVGLPRKIVW